MADSAKPSCSSCGGVVDTSTNTTDAASPVNTDETLCSGCADSSVCGTGTPCEEDHTNTVCTISYATTVKVTNSFNFPGVGESVALTLEDVTRMLPGAVLWNQTVGYLHVLSFDTETGVVVAQNKGDAGNVKSAGDLIPECTEFIVGIISASTGSGATNNSDIVPYLAADFTAPANGSCQLASVTNINGIALGDIISINSFQYRVGDIPDAVTLELCNDGDGAPTGQVIEHDSNCDGVDDVQVVVLSSDDPCSRDSVQTGVIVVCDDTGIRRPFTGTIDGQVAAWDATTEAWILVNSNLVEECTALTACAIFDIGDTGPYIIFVVSTALFTAGQSIVIGEGSGAVSATIQDIVSPTQLRINLDVAPTEVLTYDPPTRVCIEDCCTRFDDLEQEFADLEARVAALEDKVYDPVTGIDAINDDLDATIRQPCYPRQITQIYNPSDFFVTNAGAPFVPTDTGGGVYQKHYDIGDVHEFPVNPVDVTLGPYTCDVGVFVTLHCDFAMRNNGPGIDSVNFAQIHEFMLAVQGDITSENPKQFAIGYGSHPWSNYFTDVSQPIPPNFRLEADRTIDKRVNMHFERGVTVAAGVPVTFELVHRLSLDGAINGVNWANNNYQWTLAGMITVLVFRLP